jgi:GNAT superfamily N-acetyltransferase
MVATVQDAQALAAVHAASFSDPWGAEVIEAFLRSPEVIGLIAETPPAAFGLCRRIVDEAEILTLAVAPDHRRRGVGGALVDAMAEWAPRPRRPGAFSRGRAGQRRGPGALSRCGLRRGGHTAGLLFQTYRGDGRARPAARP